MTVRFAAILWLALPFSLACGEETGEVSESPSPPAEATPLSGRYQVSGSTVSPQTGYKREISGSVVVTAEGPNYTATFDLATTYPDPDAAEPLDATVIGHGEGTIEDRTLRGIAQTQLVVATVPNVDVAFAYIPRTVSTRLISTSIATISADGTLKIEIENEPAAGEDYTPTRTTLTGIRVSDAGIGGGTAAEGAQ